MDYVFITENGIGGFIVLRRSEYVCAGVCLAYDANGNLTKDLNKNIVDIQYNSLNLPSRIVFKNGDNISHVYSADGSKLRTVRVADGDTLTTDYCGNVIYENGVPVRLMTDVGYIALSDTSYHYFIKDHQAMCVSLRMNMAMWRK